MVLHLSAQLTEGGGEDSVGGNIERKGRGSGERDRIGGGESIGERGRGGTRGEGMHVEGGR